jgi:ligand-binding sensor domain-containing protein
MRLFIRCLLILTCSVPLCGRNLLPNRFLMNQSEDSRIPSNLIDTIVIDGDYVWIGTSNGLLVTTDRGATWRTITRADGLGKGGVSAVAIKDSLIWVATAFDTMTIEAGLLDAGGGLSYSTDHGETWNWIRQPVDSRDETRYAPTTTHVQNLTYDIAISDRYVWITSFGGGLRRSRIEDHGSEWEVITVDGQPFDALEYLEHRAFSVICEDGTLWVGTAGGIHKSTDEGETWTTFNHENQTEPVSGNFVVAIGRQTSKSRDLIWAATIEALGEDEYRAVSITEDGGLSWRIVKDGFFTHNFAFLDSVAYAATDLGLFKSIDYGETWGFFLHYKDEESGDQIYVTEINSVAVDSIGLWVGTSDGLVYTENEYQWKIYRAYEMPGQNGNPETYAYPNPFSPQVHNQLGMEGFVRFQYAISRSAYVTVKIYDFGMNLVTTAVKDHYRPSAGSYAEVWNGTNDLGEPVANGVYFYRVDRSGDASLWGKVMVVK